MQKASDLLRQGRNEELWQMCCGHLKLPLDQFMAIQKRLLIEQIELLNQCQLGNKIMLWAKPRTIEEFRDQVRLTSYADYCPELAEKRESSLPVQPAMWVHSSGRSGDYPCKWIPLTNSFCEELSRTMYGIGLLASCKGWGDVSGIIDNPRSIYAVAPRPYMSGALASMIEKQTPIEYLPSLNESESLSFEERIKLGFKQALNGGMDYFFGLSLVLVTVGEKFSDSSRKIDYGALLGQPSALLRLGKGLLKSKIAGRQILPRDLWNIKGIMSSGLDSGVYRERVKKLWGRYPLDIYAGTEGGIIATQTWDFSGMTFLPQFNFLEFIPEKEHFKWQLDQNYQPKTVLLDEVKAGENYEIVITNFHGGALVRYRPGDIIKITSLRDDKYDIDIPQMVFERRADGLIDFVFMRLTEKTIWQAIEKSGIPYEDWTAYKNPGEPVLNILIEPKQNSNINEKDINLAIYNQLMTMDEAQTKTLIRDDFAEMINFHLKVKILPEGAFAGYTRARQAEGADIAHLKPPHINPSAKVLSLLQKEAVPASITASSESVPVP